MLITAWRSVPLERRDPPHLSSDTQWFIASDEVVQGETRRYTHQTFQVTSAEGRTLQMRLSFDENIVFIRSLHIVTRDTDELGRPRQIMRPIRDVRLSETGFENVTPRPATPLGGEPL